MPRRRPLLAQALSLAATALVGVGCSATLPKSQPHPLLDKKPDSIEQLSLDGQLLKFPQPGKVTVVDFWSTACKPCLKMMPAIEALYQERKADGVAVIGIAVDDNPGLVGERLKKLGVRYPNALDDAASSCRGAYQVADLPQTFIFDKKGQLRVVTRGGEESEVSVIRDAVSFLLAE